MEDWLQQVEEALRTRFASSKAILLEKLRQRATVQRQSLERKKAEILSRL